MKVVILYDNSAVSPSIRSGWGFSGLVDGRILFDTGEAADPIFHNLEQLKINPEQIEAVVISHDHWDHTGGLWELLKKRKGLKVYGCPGFSAEFKKQVNALKGTLIESGSFGRIDTCISVTGEISGKYKGAHLPEQALLVNSVHGITVLTGCSHPGILTMVEKAKEIFPGLSFDLVLGGFHLRDQSLESVNSVVLALMNMGVLRVAPTHCSGKNAQIIFQQHFGERYLSVGAGMQLEI